MRIFSHPMAGLFVVALIASISCGSDKKNAKPAEEDSVEVAELQIVEPGQVFLVVTNHSKNIVSVTNVLLADSLLGLSAGTIPETCKDMATEASCQIPITASEEAAGTGTATLSLTNHSTSTISTDIEVAKTSVVINPNGSNLTQSIVGDTTGALQNFTILNIGPFTWRNAVVTAETADSAWLSLTLPGAGGCTGDIAPGDSCTVQHQISAPHDLGSTVTASGDNLLPTTQSLIPDQLASVSFATDSALLALTDKALIVTNLTSVGLNMSSLTVNISGGLTSKIIVCDDTGSNCAGERMTTCANSTVINAGSTCQIWLRAVETDEGHGSTSGTATLSFTAANGASSANISRDLDITHTSALYIGGAFSSGNTVLTNRIARWDGTTLSQVGSGLNNVVHDLEIYQGQLYATGDFTENGDANLTLTRMARWNGSNWYAVGSGLNNTGMALEVFQNKLYVGGLFTIAGESTANYIASWNGSSWNTLGDGVNSSVLALAAGFDVLNVGGLFTAADGSAAGYIATWDNTTWDTYGTGFNGPVFGLASIGPIQTAGSFTDFNSGTTVSNVGGLSPGPNMHTLQGGVNGSANAITKYNNQVVYGGSFTDAGGTTVSNIAIWTGLAWTDIDNGVNADVFELAASGSLLYVGGLFTQAGGATANYFAIWNGTSWSTLGTGFDGPLYSMMVVPEIAASFAK